MRTSFFTPKTQFTGLLCIFIFLFSGCGLKSEANQQAAKWWDNTFVKCGDSHYAYFEKATVTNPHNLVVGYQPKVTIEKGFIEFKDFSYKVEEDKASEDDKLNGTEWTGYITAKVDVSFRYYDLSKPDVSKKWSSWRSKMMIYESTLYDTMSNLGDKIQGLKTSEGKSPVLIPLTKFKGKWNEPVSEGFQKPDCSQIPQE